MFEKIIKEPKQKTETLKQIGIRCALVIAIMLMAFAVEKIAGNGNGKFFDVTKAICLVLYFVSYIVIGRKIIITAFANLFKGTIVVDALIVTVGTLICILLGQYVGAIIAMMVYYLGTRLVSVAK